MGRRAYLHSMDKRAFYLSFGYLIPLSDFIGSSRGSRFCPFHRDMNHPSSKLFRDEEGDHLYCFVCRRQFSSFDYVVRILGKDPYTYLYEKVDKDKIEKVMKRFLKPSENKKGNGVLEEFKKGGMSLPDLIDKIYGRD